MSIAPDDLSYCLDLARRMERERYLCALFAPAEARPALFALLAFSAEIALIPEAVSEPMLAFIRFAWWREALDEIAQKGTVRRQPVVQALAVAMQAHPLSRAHFDRMLEAREARVESPVMPDMAALVAYMEATSSGLLLLMLEAAIGKAAITSEIAMVARELGIAYGLTGMLWEAPHYEHRGESFLPENIAAEDAVRHVAQEAERRLLGVPLHILPREAFFLRQLAWMTRRSLRRLATIEYRVFSEARPNDYLLPLQLMLRACMGK